MRFRPIRPNWCLGVSLVALMACGSSSGTASSTGTDDAAVPLKTIAAREGTQKSLGIVQWQVSRRPSGPLEIVAKDAQGAPRGSLALTYSNDGEETRFEIAVTSNGNDRFAGTIAADGKVTVGEDTVTKEDAALNLSEAALADVILDEASARSSVNDVQASSLHVLDTSLLTGSYSTTCVAGRQGENACSGLTGNFFLSCGGLVLGALSLGRNPLSGLSTDVGKAGAAGTALGIPGCFSAAKQYDSCILYECTCKGSAPLVQSAQQDISNCTLGRRLTPPG